MDFFDKQERAEQKTKLLVVYFVFAVAGIILTLHVIFALMLDLPLNDWGLLGIVSAGVAASVLIGSTVKTMELSQGGRVVAAMLGGEPVDLNSTDPAERRLINVVEEMALASGVPVPEIYVLDDKTINAFAAGHGPGDTAIGVTRGCIDRLSRDELQGVIGHEFSHILHGDMRLNIRLIGILNGILFLAIIGGFLLRFSAYGSRDTSSRDDKNSGSITVMFMAGGLALYLVGWIGVFFGKLIKAAVSRQREFLADASAVQYTRNPDGLAGALAKIGKFSSSLLSPRAEEASHMFFGNGVGDSWLALFATHPPIEARIAEIAPGFELDSEAAAQTMPPPPASAASATAGTPGPRLAEAFLPGQPRVAAAAALLAGLPEYSLTASHELHGACALLYSLLLSEDSAVRSAQTALLGADPTVRDEAVAMFSRRGELSSAQKIGLVDITIPTLRHLSPGQYAAFRKNITDLVEADGQIHLFEYTLQKILLRHLDLSFTNATGPAVRFKSLMPLLPDVGVILSALASSGDGTTAQRDEAFRAGVVELLVKPSSFPLERTETIDLKAFDTALDHLAEAAPDVKRTVLTACGVAVMRDGGVNDAEVELLRAVADTLDCPIPPFVRIEGALPVRTAG